MNSKAQTVFDAITENPAALAGMLKTIPALDTPWYAEFRKRYCPRCEREDCNEGCPHEAYRDNLLWWLSLDAGSVEL